MDWAFCNVIEDDVNACGDSKTIDKKTALI